MSNFPSSTGCQQEPSNGFKIESNATLNAAFEKDVRPYIDLADELNSYGLADELNLPSVVVIGDQSSGKSSILEAISGIQLPRGSEMTTRCPIEMHLKKTSAYEDAQIEYTNPKHKNQKTSKTVKVADLEGALRSAQDQISEKESVTDTKIVLKIRGPSCPDLTLTDLPGIVRCSFGGDNQNIEKIRNIIKEYTHRKNVLIMCIIPANQDVATNEALTLAHEVDPERKRTIGVFTKPDLVESSCESRIMEYLNNNKIHLNMGYNIVRCRAPTELKISHTEAILKEKQFFEEHPHFKKLLPEVRGTQSLSTKLTQYLVRHMKDQLPRMQKDVRTKLTNAQNELDDFGSDIPIEKEAKRLFMMERLESVLVEMEKYLIKGNRISVDIIKSENINTDEIDLSECATSFLWRSLFRHFSSELSNTTSGHLHFNNGLLSVQKVQQRMIALRGNELPRFFNFQLFEELVLDHLKQYEEPALECLEESIKGIDNIAIFVCGENLKQCPALQRRIEDECRNALGKCSKKAKKMVLRDLKKENEVFTQDSTYLSQIQQMLDKDNAPKSSNSSTSGAEAIKSLSTYVMQADGEEGNEDKHNAEVMQRLISVYLNVVNQRLSDTVPQTIRLDLYEGFVEKFKKGVRNIALSGDVSLIDEDEDVTMKRKELIERISVFKKALRKLNDF